MLDDKYIYRASFSAPIRTVYASEQGKFISLASLSEIRELAPESAHIEQNADLLYNVFDAAVINRVNKNDDGLLAETAAKIFKNFIHKPMNIEHDRSSVIGHIINAGFSEYNTNKVVNADNVAEIVEPIYLTLSAVAYKLCDPSLCTLLIESSDPTSAQYNAISASWELGFTDYYILLGHRDVSQGELIKDPTQVAAFSHYLKCNGGPGVLEDGRPVYRIVAGDVLPLGCAYTTTPAADVSGVLVVKTENKDEEDASASSTDEPISVTIESEEGSADSVALASKTLPNTPILEISTENQPNIQNNYSQQQPNIVKINSIMNLKDIKDITDENFAQCSASQVKNFLAEEIEKVSIEYGAKLDAANLEASQRTGEKEVLATEVAELKTKLEALTSELNSAKQLQAAEKAQADFNLRMTDLNEKYNLTEKDKEVVAKAVRGLDDESYAAWYSDFEVLAELKSKAYIAKSQVQASIDDVLDNAQLVSEPVTPTVEDLKAKMDAAWAVDSIVNLRR